jgi:hypothetical protein
MDDQEMDEQREAEMAAALPPRDCVCCRKRINPFRLLEMPTTEICVECSERVGGEFVAVVTEVTLRPHAGSFKSTTGGVNVEFRRRRLPRF